MNYENRDVSDITVVRVMEEQLTSREAPEMKTTFLKLIAESKKIVLLNLEEVSYMDSTGLGSFLFGIRQAEANDKEVAFCGLTPRIQSLIRIAHLDDVLEIYNTEEEALKEILEDLES